jgi:hypothetical protein
MLPKRTNMPIVHNPITKRRIGIVDARLYGGAFVKNIPKLGNFLSKTSKMKKLPIYTTTEATP